MTYCEDCKYWELVTGDHGDCRRHAPRIIEGQFWSIQDGYIPETRAVWVKTDLMDWCGDGELRAAEE